LIAFKNSQHILLEAQDMATYRAVPGIMIVAVDSIDIPSATVDVLHPGVGTDWFTATPGTILREGSRVRIAIRSDCFA
jgi:hypothetical protein